MFGRIYAAEYRSSCGVICSQPKRCEVQKPDATDEGVLYTGSTGRYAVAFGQTSGEDLGRGTARLERVDWNGD
jgi:hypothetical protein